MLIEGFRRTFWALGLIVVLFHYAAWAEGEGAIAATPPPSAVAGVSWPLLAAAFEGGALVFGGFMVGKRDSG